jgi:hypothetical protein
MEMTLFLILVSIYIYHNYGWQTFVNMVTCWSICSLASTLVPVGHTLWEAKQRYGAWKELDTFVGDQEAWPSTERVYLPEGLVEQARHYRKFSLSDLEIRHVVKIRSDGRRYTVERGSPWHHTGAKCRSEHDIPGMDGPAGLNVRNGAPPHDNGKVHFIGMSDVPVDNVLVGRELGVTTTPGMANPVDPKAEKLRFDDIMSKSDLTITIVEE